MSETKVLKMLGEMNSRFSEDMANLNNKLDAKFNAFEKKIEEHIKFEDMTGDTVDESNSRDEYLQKSMERLWCEVSRFNDRIQWVIRMYNITCGCKVKNSEISAEIEHLKLGDGVLRPTVKDKVSLLERKKQSNIEFQSRMIDSLQGQLEAMDENIKFRQRELRRLFAANKSEIIRLDDMRFLLDLRAEAIKKRFKMEQNSACQIESDIRGFIKQIADESKALKKKLVDSKVLKEENLS